MTKRAPVDPLELYKEACEFVRHLPECKGTGSDESCTCGAPQFLDRLERALSSCHPMGWPLYAVGAKVKIVPLDGAPGRIVSVSWEIEGLRYHVRYFDHGDAKVVALLGDEIE